MTGGQWEVDQQFAGWLERLLAQVEDRLVEVVSPQSQFIRQAARYLVVAGGKRFRPSLTIAAAGLGSQEADTAALVDAAVIMEMTHVASLYHDDVMDEATLRRGIPSANRRWGNQVSIMIGDYLLATASELGVPLGREFSARQSQTLSRLVQGQIGEITDLAEGVPRIDHYLSVLSDKTGSLIATSAWAGGLLTGLASDQLDALARFGEELGIVFQMADDLIDIASDESGKRKGTDLREGVLTLAPLMVLADPRPEDGRLVHLLSAPVAEGEVEETLTLLRAHPVMAEAQREIARRAALAKSQLEGFAESPAKRALTLLVDQAQVRSV